MVKEVLCMPHSHLDIGYTHPQPMLMEQQVDYINQALELIKQTENYPEETRFCWTVEASCVLKKWLETASEIQIADMKKYIAEGRICLTALPMHTTPGVDIREMAFMLSDLRELEEKLDTRIHIAINHDVDGQPWTLGQIMLDSGVDFYLTGVNIHYGGIPFPRPLFFRWKMADGRKLDTFLGEHYSIFSQVIQSRNPSTENVHRGLTEQIQRMEANGYQKEYIFLTATNPPQYDNNPPDWKLPELIQRYNEENHEYKVRFVTAQMLQEKLLKEEREKGFQIPVYSGDWTDYWNFGCASTARETRVSRKAKDTLKAAELLECLRLEDEQHYKKAKQECLKNIMMYDEHTWGASSSVANPKGYETYSQLIHKWHMAYKAADLSGYLLSRQMEKTAQNPYQSDELEGILAVNPTDEPQLFEVTYPERYREKERHLSTRRSKSFIPYIELDQELETDGLLLLPAFTAKELSFGELDALKENSRKYAADYKLSGDFLETPYYTVHMDLNDGSIRQIVDKKTGSNVLSDRGYCLFEPLVERIDDTEQENARRVLFGESVELRNNNISQWNHEWKARYSKMECSFWQTEEEDYHVAIVRKGKLNGFYWLEQRMTFYTYTPKIRMEVTFDKEPIAEPESLLFAVPLKLNPQWKCSYDTAGEVVMLDEEQLGHSCRDYLTVDTAVSMYDQERCAVLSCPDAPMVQVGNFNFGREHSSIPREEDPLLLAWTLNNYWNTNFMADQNGRMTFAYELNFHDTFSARRMKQDGLSAKNPVKIDALVKASGKEQRLLECQGNSAVLGVYPAKEKDSMVLILKNQTENADVLSIHSSHWKIRNAFVITPQEENMEELKTTSEQLEVEMPVHATKMIKISVQK